MTSAWGVLELPLGTVSHSCTEIGTSFRVLEHNTLAVNTMY